MALADSEMSNLVREETPPPSLPSFAKQYDRKNLQAEVYSKKTLKIRNNHCHC